MMTNDLNDIKNIKSTRRTHIQMANEECVKVKITGSTEITSNLKLKNGLFFPSLSHKVLSISQLTKELNCCVLMFFGGCYVQEIPTGKIIGHGTEIGGLHYVDEVAQHGSAMLTYTSDAQKIRMWHKRLDHPSLGYLKCLFPSISFKNFSLDCESCVLAKPFMLINHL